MVKAGLIFGGLAFFGGIVFSLLSPICAICIPIFLGLGAGYVAARNERPFESQDSLKVGAGAGAIAGGLMIPGQLIAAVVNASTMAATGGAEITELFGLPPLEPSTIWAAQVVFGCCFGLLNLILMTGLGAAGSAIWLQRVGGRQSDGALPPAL
jgi:hypothetical protein